jgi:catechol 2,3-dioxygenase-like lactoylglutathione lyase family enzyme
MMQPRGILETVVYARDLGAARRFYVDVLGLEVYAEQADRHVFFRCGSGMFLVFNPDTTAKEVTTVNGSDIPLHGATGVGHMAFVMTEVEIKSWRTQLGQHGVPIESEVVWPNGAISLYFRDPAGNVLELATPRLWGLSEEKFE